MVFSSLSFIFVFLPAVLLTHTLAPRRWRNWVLLGASCLFYAWGEPRYLAIMLGTIVIDYLGALAIDRVRASVARKVLTAAVVAANLAVLGYFKYFNFVVENLNAFCGANLCFIKVVLPIGISFYTFQALSYVVDVARGEVTVQRNPFKLALYVTLFPQLIAGPIVRYRDVCAQIEGRCVLPESVVGGLSRFIVGLAKKVLIANTMGAVADTVFALPTGALGCGTAWLGAVAYSFQLFYDFSGYSDMAIGLGRMFGFTFKENFDHPYVSRSITEFWRRWHISLSSWFREYLYIPLGGNRVSRFCNIVNLAIVFLATGVWHGAAWTFIIWGCWHGAFVIFERITNWHHRGEGLIGRVIHHVYALAVIVFGWVLFRAETFVQAGAFFQTMWGVGPPASVPPSVELLIGEPLTIVAFLAAIVCATPVRFDVLEAAHSRGICGWLATAYLLLLFYLSVVQIVASTYNPFIYFRF